MEDDAGGESAVLTVVSVERVQQERVCVVLVQVRLAVVAADPGGSARTITPSPRPLNTWATEVSRESLSLLR